ncbi:MAG: lipoyl(octanoyl) transferase LipB [Firmicutes bacterium]|jgi:lipoate-protein ligase B|nr:lipoyl(octanoyl) transferase LipB [Bacillota bacterium]
MWVLSLGQEDYLTVYRLQRALVEARREGLVPDVLILVEHPPVFTLGRAGGEKNILVGKEALVKEGIEVFPVERGGDVTYHGPGQLVGYPIMDLKEQGRDLHLLLRGYEEVFIRLLADYGIVGSRIKGLTGVWVGEEKILSIGIAVRRWVSYHGFAFNIDPNLDHFRLINPCGLDIGMTSLARLLGRPVSRGEVQPRVLEMFASVFHVELQPWPANSPWPALIEEVDGSGHD